MGRREIKKKKNEQKSKGGELFEWESFEKIAFGWDDMESIRQFDYANISPFQHHIPQQLILSKYHLGRKKDWQVNLETFVPCEIYDDFCRLNF